MPVLTAQEKKPEVSSDTTDERVRILDGTVKDLSVLVSDLQQEIVSLKRQNQVLSKKIAEMKIERQKGVNAEPEIIKRDQIIQNLKHRLVQEERNNKKLQRRLKRMKETTDELRPQGNCGDKSASRPVT